MGRLGDLVIPPAGGASSGALLADDWLAREWQGNGHLDVPIRDAIGSVQTLSSGSAVFTYLTPVKDLTITKISMVASAAASSGLTLARFGLWTAAANDDLTLVARSANDTTIFGVVNTVYERSLDTAGGFPASYTLLRGVRYAAGCLTVGTTAGSVRGATAGTAALAALPPRSSGSRTGQADLANYVPNSNLSVIPWVRLSA